MLAGLLLCLHTAIPHVHGTLHSNSQSVEISDKSSCVEEGVLHLLKDLLSSDLGEDHLENFTPDLQKDLNGTTYISPAVLLAPFPVLNHVLAEITSARQAATYLASLPPDDPVINAGLSRGPPVFA